MTAYKESKIDIDELSSVADILSTYTYSDPELFHVLDAARELDYYKEIAKDEKTFEKFMAVVEKYYEEIK